MSVVVDQVRRVDGELDKLQLGRFSFTTSAAVDEIVAQSDRVLRLQGIVKALSTTFSSRPLLSAERISHLLAHANLVASDDGAGDVDERELVTTKSAYESELEWLLVSKATIQTYGVILNTLLDHTIPISDDIWYWDEVLGSYTYTALYSIQTSPLRLWGWSKDIYHDATRKFQRLRDGEESDFFSRDLSDGLTAQWKQFYGLVQDSIRARSLSDIRQRVLSPVALSRSEARSKQKSLKRLREMSASGLGVLVEEGLRFDVDEDPTQARTVDDGQEWQMVVERSVALMDTVLRHVTTLEHNVAEFEDTVFAAVEDDPESSIHLAEEDRINVPAKLAQRLQDILNYQIPTHLEATSRIRAQSGRPSRLIRYWLPLTALVLSSSTIGPYLLRRKAAIAEWIRDFGVTVRDFWFNWVVEPTKKVISTIRHDKDSEIALMSRESLKGDRDSLERMVVDFASEHPAFAGSDGPLTEAQISEIRHKVKEGDLTPVLKAYEQNLKKPLIGAVKGDLVRTLLIQVQKTKVDVEVAMSGIDSLLKSQELVFGFVGLTPGIMVCWALLKYFETSFGSRKGLKAGRKAGQSIRVLRNIDRILTLSRPSSDGIINYKDHGLLLCEINVLRDRAEALFPGEVKREFLEDVAELADIRIGVERQSRVLERIRWAYGKWWSR